MNIYGFWHVLIKLHLRLNNGGLQNTYNDKFKGQK